MSAALVLVVGGLSWLLMDHYLRIRRARMHPCPDTPTEPPASEARMSMSQQQLQTLGLSRVRRVVASGKYSAADVKKWKSELGEKPVQQILDAAEPAKPAKKEAVAQPVVTATATKE